MRAEHSSWGGSSGRRQSGEGHPHRARRRPGTQDDPGRARARARGRPRAVVIIPDSPVALRAFRVWAVAATAAGPRLQSTAAGFWSRLPVWSSFERFEARCLSLRTCGSESLPNPEHGCGIYAFRALAEALRWAASIARQHPLVVVGEIDCWGKVIETERGYRVQFAYPAAFIECVSPRVSPRHVGFRGVSPRGLSLRGVSPRPKRGPRVGTTELSEIYGLTQATISA